MGIELIEPIGSPSPWADLIEQQRGSAPQHIGFDYKELGKVDEWVARLQAKGGTWTVGAPGNFYAYLDFHDTLGVTIAITATSALRAPETVTSRR